MKEELKSIKDRLYMLQLETEDKQMNEADPGKSNLFGDSALNLENAITEIDHVVERS